MARAYNHSIYLMLGVPYVLLGGVGFMVFRHLRLRAAVLPLPVPGEPYRFTAEERP